MTHIKLLVFDWDGTLADSTAMIVASMQAAFTNCAMQTPAESRIRQIIGLSLGEAIHRLAPDMPDDVLGVVETEYRKMFVTTPHRTTLFDGVRDVLTHCRAANIELAIATGKGHSGLTRALQEAKLNQVFNFIRTADSCASKPSPEMLEEILHESGYSAGEALMIGDTTYDLEMAHAAGMQSVAVTYGAHSEQALRQLNPKHVIDDIRQLPNTLGHVVTDSMPY